VQRENLRGWIALGLSSLIVCFWAFWGIIENFHEGWWWPQLSQRLLMTVAYLTPMLVSLAMLCLALAWPRIGAFSFFLVGTAFSWFIFRARWNHLDWRLVLSWLPTTGLVVGLGALWWNARPRPLRLAWLLALLPPLVTVLAFGAEPAWRVLQRHDDGVRTERLVQGNGVALVWAPAGPGWVRDAKHACKWAEAMRIAEHLSADGQTVMDEPQHIWRLPTVEEAVASLTRGGVNAQGSWDPVSRRARYARLPDKESPLWEVYAETIYWWTATEDGPDAAFRVVYNGQVFSMPKDLGMGTQGFRAVREP